MFVCICNQVTDRQIRCAVEEGIVDNFKSLSNELNVGTCCGKCKNCAKKILHQVIQDNAYQQSIPDRLIPVLSPS